MIQPLCKICNIGSGWLQYRLHFELCIPFNDLCGYDFLSS